MEVDRISYLFGSFSRRRQSQDIEHVNKHSNGSPNISHDRSSSAPHNTRKFERPTNRSKSVCNVPFDESKIRCPKCQQFFVEPRVLPCLHTFCIGCLQKLERTSGPEVSSNHGNVSSKSMAKEVKFDNTDFNDESKSPCPKQNLRITCPICRSWSELPAGGVTNLPVNYLLQHKLVLATINANVTRLLCDLCTADVPATSRCTECALSFCLHCTEEHLRQRSYAQHEVLNIQEARRKGITRIRRQIMCPIHLEHELSIFCSTCCKVVCKECATLIHKDHSCEAASHAAKSFISNLRCAVDRARLGAETSAISLGNLQAAYKKIEMQCTNVQAQVDMFINNYIKAIESHHKNLNAQIQKVRQDKLASVEGHREQLQKKIQRARDVTAFIDELLNEGTDVEVLSFAKPVLTSLGTCTSLSKTATKLKKSDSILFLPDTVATEIKTPCPLYGVITTQVVFPKNCNIITKGLTNIKVGMKVEIIVETKDKTNTCLERGGDLVTAEIHYRKSTRNPTTTKVPVKDLRNGKYSFSFIPEAIGKVLLYVWVNGQLIKNNPFPITVCALKPHQGTFHCCSFCSSKGIKEVTCGCGGKMPGGYKGCGHGHEGHPGKRHWSCCGSCVEQSECSKNNNSKHYQFTL